MDNGVRGCEFAYPLTARTARRYQMFAVSHNDHFLNFSVSAQNHGGNSALFRAGTCGIGRIFNVTAGIQPAALRFYDCADGKLGVRSISLFHRRAGHLQHFIKCIHDATFIYILCTLRYRLNFRQAIKIFFLPSPPVKKSFKIKKIKLVFFQPYRITL